MTALAHKITDHELTDVEFAVDPMDEFIDELFASTPRRSHLRVVTESERAGDVSTAVVSISTSSALRTPAPMWQESDLGARNAVRSNAGLLRLFWRTFQAVLVVGSALVLMVAMLGSPVVATDVAPETTTHLVQPGDTLWNLAVDVTAPGEDVGATVEVIKAANDLTSSLLVPGDQLLLPAVSR